jgi:general secretion pathway protein I
MKNTKLRNLDRKLRCNLKICNLQFVICNSRKGGFTLIEVIVAIAILAISLVMVMQLFSGGLKASKTSSNYTRAIIHAKNKMEELSIEPVQGSGKFEDGFEWESEVQPHEELEHLDLNLMKIKVKVLWAERMHKKKSVELVSLKRIVEEEMNKGMFSD